MIMITLSWQIEYVHCKIAAIVSWEESYEVRSKAKLGMVWESRQGIGIIPGPTIFIAAQVAVLLPLCIFTRWDNRLKNLAGEVHEIPNRLLINSTHRAETMNVTSP